MPRSLLRTTSCKNRSQSVMGGEGAAELAKLKEENAQLKSKAADLQSQLKQTERDKIQLQTSYEEALQALADSEAKREISEKELKLAQDQMGSMWRQLESLHKKIDGMSPPVTSGENSMVNETSLELQCTLCREKIRMQDLESHSRACSSPQPRLSRSNSKKVLSSSPSKMPSHPPPKTSAGVVAKPRQKEPETEYLIISVTRSPPGTTDLSPFKIITKTNCPQFPATVLEVNRSQNDFQWLYDALQYSCPERIVPPLKPPISLDATMLEFQRFLSRIAAHKTLCKHHLFIAFLSGTSEEMKSIKAKHSPYRRGEQVQYKPAVGRDTNSGPLVATKEYLTTLEQNLLGLANHLEQSMRRKTSNERTAHWFRAVCESEPADTYLKAATSNLARTCDAMESHHGDSEDTLLIHNLQSIADYVRAALGLLRRVESAVDKFLYWDEEMSLMDAVAVETSSEAAEETEDATLYDDSGVSDVTSSSEGHVTNRMSAHVNSDNLTLENSCSEKLALASKYCTDAKDYLEMMCQGLSAELSQFDLQKELELKQVFIEYAARQLGRHEKCQGKWFAMKFILDVAVAPSNRAIEFSRQQASQETTMAGHTSKTAVS